VDLPDIPYGEAENASGSILRATQEVSRAAEVISDGVQMYAREQAKSQMHKATTQLVGELQRELEDYNKSPNMTAGELRKRGEGNLPPDVREELKGKDNEYLIPTWRVQESLFRLKSKEAKDRAASLVAGAGWRERWALQADEQLEQLRAAVTSATLKAGLESGKADFLQTFKDGLATARTPEQFRLQKDFLKQSRWFTAAERNALLADADEMEAFQPARTAIADDDVPAMRAALVELKSPPPDSLLYKADQEKRAALKQRIELRLEVSEKEVKADTERQFMENERWAYSVLNDAIYKQGIRDPKTLFSMLPDNGMDPSQGNIRPEKWHQLAEMIKDATKPPSEQKQYSDPVVLSLIYSSYRSDPESARNGLVNVPVERKTADGGTTVAWEKMSLLDLFKAGKLTRRDFERSLSRADKLSKGTAPDIAGPNQTIQAILARPRYGISIVPQDRDEEERRVAAEVEIAVYGDEEFQASGGALKGAARTDLLERLVDKHYELVKNGLESDARTQMPRRVLRGRTPLWGKTVEQEEQAFAFYSKGIEDGLESYKRKGVLPRVTDAMRRDVFDYLHRNWNALMAELRGSNPKLKDRTDEELKLHATILAVDRYVQNK
jgi:hypothetical protein